jgi:hypothetical protein
LHTNITHKMSDKHLKYLTIYAKDKASKGFSKVEALKMLMNAGIIDANKEFHPHYKHLAKAIKHK